MAIIASLNDNRHDHHDPGSDQLEEEAIVEASQPTYWLTRFMILRCLGLVYVLAFLVAINQVLPLIGSHGLTPVDLYLHKVNAAYGSAGFFKLPSLFWFWHSDTAFTILGWIGLLLSLLLLSGYANAITLFLLWLIYLSFVHVGQEWYGYGWEIQLTETGFLAIFLCPLLDMHPFPKKAPPFLIIVLFRWLIFRIMLGAGLIKLRGDAIWRNATALYYQFETQPIPGPFSRWFHFLPHGILKAGVWFNHLAELIAPGFVFGPRIARHIAGVVIILFQVNIFLSGNLSFLNLLTVVPALACLDDACWSRILPHALVRQAQEAAAQSVESKPMHTTAIVVTIIISLLSIRPAINLMSSQQIMNTSFDPLDLVNTYGAFGTVGKERYNVIFEGTLDNDSSEQAHWKPYIYKGLPVSLERPSPQIAPYHLRFDWQMWFASMSTPSEYPWTLHLVYKLLHHDPDAIKLFAHDPFAGQPPRYVRAILYRYAFAPPGNSQGQVWKRSRIDTWLPPMAANDPMLLDFLKAEGWLP